MAARALGHLGHCFYVASWRQRAACCHCLWVIWVIVFLMTQMTQKAGAGVRDGFKSLGHLGHFVIE